MSKTIRELWQDPQYWERMIEVIRETWRSPVLREWRAMAVRERFQDPEVRERQEKRSQSALRSRRDRPGHVREGRARADAQRRARHARRDVLRANRSKAVNKANQKLGAPFIAKVCRANPDNVLHRIMRWMPGAAEEDTWPIFQAEVMNDAELQDACLRW